MLGAYPLGTIYLGGSVMTPNFGLDMVLEFAWGSKPTSEVYMWQASDALRVFSYRRGRQNELNRVEAGTGGQTVIDDERDFDPENTGSPYYPNVKPFVPVRMRAILNGITYPMFQQYVERYPRERQGPSYAERSLSSFDAFATLAQAKLAGKSYAGESSGVRIGHVLDDAGQPTAGRSISTGQSTLDAVAFAADDETRALEHILQVADSESGLFFIDSAGSRVFLGRNELFSSPYSVSQATFMDLPGSGGILYADPVREYGPDLIVNDWYGKRATGVLQNASDVASMDDYFQRSSPVRSSLVDTDTELLAQMQFFLAQFKDPIQQFKSIKVVPGTELVAWETILRLDLGDRVTVGEHPPGGGASINDYLIQGLEVKHNGGPWYNVEVIYQLWLAQVAAWFTFDDPVTGRFDYNKMGY